MIIKWSHENTVTCYRCTHYEWINKIEPEHSKCYKIICTQQRLWSGLSERVFNGHFLGSQYLFMSTVKTDETTWMGRRICLCWMHVIFRFCCIPFHLCCWQFQDIATPWKSILMSPAVWAICAAHTANNWGFYTMLTCLPSYLKNVLKFDIKTVSSCIQRRLIRLGRCPGWSASSLYTQVICSHVYQVNLKKVLKFDIKTVTSCPDLCLRCANRSFCLHVYQATSRMSSGSI